MDVSGYAPTRPTDLPPRVLLLLDRDSDGGRPIQEALRSHGCQVVAVPRSAVAADPRSVSLLDVDLVLGYGPHNGSLLALRTLEDRARGLTARPVFAWWLLENLPNPAWPDRLALFLSACRLRADGWLDRLGTGWEGHVESWLRAGQRVRILGELRRLAREGGCDLIVAASGARACYLRRHGIEAAVIPYGYVEQFGRDLSLERDIPVAFLGQLHSRRRRHLLSRLGASLGRRGISLNVVSPTRALEGQERTHFLNRCVVLINVLKQPQDSVGHRLLLGAANKALIVSEPMRDCEWLEPGRHLVVVPFEHMADTVCHYLSHPEERGAITEAAYRLVTEELTLHRQVGRLLALAEPRRLRGAAS